MAEWTNLFDLGECVVKVSESSVPIFESVMALGQSEVITTDFNEYQIEVSSEGSVSLSRGAGWPGGNYLRVDVIPQYEPIENVRVRDVEFWEAASNGNAIKNSGEGFKFFDTMHPVAPDPMDITDAAGPSELVAVEAGVSD